MENKWEYDYSSQDKNESGDTGYPNVGSSGMNTANQYNDPQPEPETAYTAPQTDNGAGGATPPVHPVQPQDAQPPKKKKKFNGKRVARSAVALVLAAAMGFAGGFVGAKFGGSGKVVIQQVAPSSTADSASGSDNSITAASSSGSSLTTEQVADLVSPSVVVITTEQVVYSQWSWYGQNQVESGAFGCTAGSRRGEPRQRRGLRAGRQGHQCVRCAGTAGLRERGAGLCGR